MRLNVEDYTEEMEPKPASAKEPKKEPAKKRRRDPKGYMAIALAVILSLFILATNVAMTYGDVDLKLKDVDKLTLKSVSAEAAVQDEEEDEEIVIKMDDLVVRSDTVSSPSMMSDGGEIVEEAQDEWHFYNTDLQDNGIAKDDYNFGVNPVVSNPETVDKLIQLISTKGMGDSITMEEIAGDINPDDIDNELRERLRKDPALGAAVMAWSDSILGTRYLGKFYSEAKEQWDAAMNAAKEKWIDDKEGYDKTLDAFFKFLDSATKKEIKKQKSGLTDQMYMNPYTVDGVPDIVVMESADHSGWFIVYTFTIKETAVKEIKFRMDCGFQPTNVATVMKVKAKSNPNKKKTTSGGGTTTTTPVTIPQQVITSTPIINTTTPNVVINNTNRNYNTGGGGGTVIITPPSGPDPVRPDPGPIKPDDPVNPVQPDDPDPIVPIDPIPTPAKDPTNGTDILPNDDPGPEENTNNPADPNTSTEDQPTNSNHMTPDEYKDAINENKEANDTSREGGDSNEPSTPAPSSDTHVDNNADEGTGHGGIDKPTEHSDSSVDHDSSGGHWDGPSD